MILGNATLAHLPAHNSFLRGQHLDISFSQNSLHSIKLRFGSDKWRCLSDLSIGAFNLGRLAKYEKALIFFVDDFHVLFLKGLSLAVTAHEHSKFSFYLLLL